MKKKLIFITEALWVGGIETALINLLNRMDYGRFDVTLLVIRGSLELADRVNPQCRLIVADRDALHSFRKPYAFRRLYHLTEESDHPSALHKAMMWSVPAIKSMENQLYARYIQKEFAQEHYDTAIIYSDRTAEIAVRAIRADRFLLFYHNAVMAKAFHDEIGYQRSEKIIAVSESKLADLKAYRPRYAEKMTAIHNIVDIDDIFLKSREEQDPSFRESDFNIVTCGRLAHQKAIDWAILACKQLLDLGYSNLHWWVLGGGPDETALKEQIADLHLENHFHLLGIKTNPYPFIANCDLYVQTSRYENYSVVILEAMVLCKPILATIPSADQQIQSGVSGLLCEANPASIASGIRHLIDMPDKRKQYSQWLCAHSLEEENERNMQKLYELL